VAVSSAAFTVTRTSTSARSTTTHSAPSRSERPTQSSSARKYKRFRTSTLARGFALPPLHLLRRRPRPRLSLLASVPPPFRLASLPLKQSSSDLTLVVPYGDGFSLSTIALSPLPSIRRNSSSSSSSSSLHDESWCISPPRLRSFYHPLSRCVIDVVVIVASPSYRFRSVKWLSSLSLSRFRVESERGFLISLRTCTK